MLAYQLKRSAIKSSAFCRQAAGAGFAQQTKAFSAQAELKHSPEEKHQEITLENARPFKEVPGPSTLAFVRGFMPGGIYHGKSVTQMTQISQKVYGNIFRYPGMFGRPPFVITSNPDDYSVMFRNEGQWPYRRSFMCIEYHRGVHRRDYFGDQWGVIFSNGEPWGSARTAVNPVLMKPQNVRNYLNTMQEVSSEFLQRIREIRDPTTSEVPADFENEIQRLTFETVCSVALNKQLGLIRKQRDNPDAVKLFENLRLFFDKSFDLEIAPPIWKVYKTRTFHEMMSVLDTITDLCDKYIKEALAEIEKGNTTPEGKEKSVIEKLLKIDRKLSVVMAMDLLMGGVDTTSTTITGILLCLAKNPEKQAKLFEEAKNILPNKDSELTLEDLKSLPYLRACIKEAMRIYPIGSGTLRRMPHDVVLSGYRIPAGTDVMTGATVQLWDDAFVPRAKEFIPERFLRTEDKDTELAGSVQKPFMFVPFGFGPRMCAGKRVVELEMELNILRLVRNFNIKFDYSVENAFKSKLLLTPNIPLKFKFEERAA